METGRQQNNFEFDIIRLALDENLLSKEFYKKQPYYYDTSKIWWLWSKPQMKWKIIDETDLFINMDPLGQSQISLASNKKGMILEALKRHGRLKKPIDPPKSWIQFKNKVLDIDTNEEHTVSPNYFFCNPIPWDIGDNEDCPNTDKLFADWVGEKYVATLYEIIGYCMITEYPIHRLFVLFGRGRNGKGIFMELLTILIGKNNITSTDLQLIIRNRFESSKLYKKLVALIGETNFNTIDDTAMLKKLTGKDLIGFEYKNKNPFEDYNYAKIIIATNTLPESNDNTDGFHSRFTTIDFPNQYTETHNFLQKTIPQKEYPSIIRKAINHVKQALQNGTFTNDGSIEDRRKRYEERSNPFEKFIETKCAEDYNSIIPKYEFKENLFIFLQNNGYRRMSEAEINTKMKEKYISEKRSVYVNGEEKRWYCWVGLGWKKDEFRPLRPNVSTLTTSSIREKLVINMETLGTDRTLNGWEPKQKTPEEFVTDESQDPTLLYLSDGKKHCTKTMKNKIGTSDEKIARLKRDGIVFEPKSGFIQLKI